MPIFIPGEARTMTPEEMDNYISTENAKKAARKEIWSERARAKTPEGKPIYKGGVIEVDRGTKTDKVDDKTDKTPGNIYVPEDSSKGYDKLIEDINLKLGSAGFNGSTPRATMKDGKRLDKDLNPYRTKKEDIDITNAKNSYTLPDRAKLNEDRVKLLESDYDARLKEARNGDKFLSGDIKSPFGYMVDRFGGGIGAYLAAIGMGVKNFGLNVTQMGQQNSPGGRNNVVPQQTGYDKMLGDMAQYKNDSYKDYIRAQSEAAKEMFSKKMDFESQAEQDMFRAQVQKLQDIFKADVDVAKTLATLNSQEAIAFARMETDKQITYVTIANDLEKANVQLQSAERIALMQANTSIAVAMAGIYKDINLAKISVKAREELSKLMSSLDIEKYQKNFDYQKEFTKELLKMNLDNATLRAVIGGVSQLGNTAIRTATGMPGMPRGYNPYEDLEF